MTYRYLSSGWQKVILDLSTIAHRPNVFQHDGLLFRRIRLLVDLKLLVCLEIASLVFGEIVDALDERRGFVASRPDD